MGNNQPYVNWRGWVWLYVGWRLEWPNRLFSWPKRRSEDKEGPPQLIPEKEINKIKNTAISLMLPNKTLGAE